MPCTKTFRVARWFAGALALALAGGLQAAQAADLLPSWNDGPARDRIVSFVQQVSDPAHPGFVPGAERIAVFDNDGTLWAEQPMYFQLFFIMHRLRVMAPEHSEWNDTEPFKSALAGDLQGVAATGHEGLMKLMAATHAGMSAEAFDRMATDWADDAVHPTTGRRFVDMRYQPMIELLDYLRANGFQTWIVSGGGMDFMRPWTESAYGIPPEQVVGSHLQLKYEVVDGEPRLVKQPEIALLDDKEGKPIGIQRFIGRRPIMAFGNSDGDFQMLEWTTAGEGPRLGVYIHHTDAEREWAYDRDSHVGRLARGLDEADQRGWLVVDMKRDWKRVFPVE